VEWQGVDDAKSMGKTDVVRVVQTDAVSDFLGNAEFFTTQAA
jgi:hypothetical protein